MPRPPGAQEQEFFEEVKVRVGCGGDRAGVEHGSQIRQAQCLRGPALVLDEP